MKIQIGQIPMDKVTSQRITYKNKSNKYLTPCLKAYGDEFTNKISNVFKVAVGVGDIVVKNAGKPYAYQKNLFILLDSQIARPRFLMFMDWIREQEMYVDDYVFDNITKSTFHMIVIKFPEQYYEALDMFKKGEYSKMYSRADIEKFFSNKPHLQKILVKDHEYRIEFTKKLNRLFDSTLTPDDIDGELDLPPREDGEVFNTHLKKK